MTNGQPASEFRYWAFISYSHKDASWGRWLHKALETWRVPRRLVGMPIAAGKVPARLSPIFRDRDELPTTSDLGAAVEEALGQSWCLIVICSPESAQSRWVNEEVLAFQRLGRSDRIHCLIVDGGPDPAAPLRFPPSLEQAQAKSGNGRSEPVAADARRFADGRSHALLKLIAGILGIRYDTLVQRDQQRKHRNLFWITCASLALVVVLAVSTLIAVTSRREAVDQRSHAEGLVEFMIGDLRKKLEPDGKLATLDAVGKEALAYYAAQKSEDLDAEGLARRARALHMIGEVYNLRGELDEALKVFQQAADSTKELLQREPNNGQRTFDHAQSVFWVGYIAYERGNIKIAEPAFLEYKRLAERLVVIDPANEEWQAEVGYANSNLGTLLFRQGRLDEALPVFTRELSLAKQFSDHDPANLSKQLRTSQALAWLSDVQRGEGKFADAISNRQSEVAIYAHLLQLNPNSKDAKEAMLVSEHHLAVISLALGDLSSGLVHVRNAVGLAEELLGIDPENTRWMRISANAFRTFAQSLAYSGDLAEAKKADERSEKLNDQLVKRDASVVEWQYDWVLIRLMQAQISNLSNDPGNALLLTGIALHRLNNLSEDQLSRPARQEALIRANWLIGEANEVMGQNEGATLAWETIVELVHQSDGVNVPFIQSANAVALMALGRTNEATRIRQKLETIGYNEPAFAMQMNRVRNAGGK